MEEGGLAQLGERLPCKQEVTSSNLVFSIWWSVIITCTLKTAYKKEDRNIKTSEVMKEESKGN